MRIDPDPTADESTLLAAYLTCQRETMLSKSAGLNHEQLTRRHPPSDLTLAGLIYHLTLVEHSWMEVRFAGRPEQEPWSQIDWEADPNWEFRTAADLQVDDLLAGYRDACARSDAVMADAAALDQLSAAPMRNGRSFSLRWVLLHLIEETARHAGHADLIREAIDGSVGE